MPPELESQPQAWIAVARGLSDRAGAELGLVLVARGIEHSLHAAADGWALYVAAPDLERTLHELDAYRAENQRPSGQRHIELRGYGLPGMFAYAALLCVMFVVVRQSPLGLDWLGAGRLEAGGVRAGEWWRALTALTVHLDFGHVGGNIAFGSFFGYFVARYLGTGVGWLAVLAAGFLGNLINAYVQGAEHRSIGASTAVFAALGLLTAYTWRRGFWRDTPWRARFAPIVAGLGLLAFTGTGGENTDLFAHLFGFVAGFAMGLAFAGSALVEKAGPRAQRWAGAGALGALAGAWLTALLVDG
jgi:membrane associated rhomboid family serine protease